MWRASPGRIFGATRVAPKQQKQREAARRWREKNPDYARQYDLKHRERRLAKQRARRAANPRNTRAEGLLRRYGLTVAAWDAMLAGQNHSCAICKTVQSGKRRWHTDHDHRSGIVRGILCDLCNKMLGQAKDDAVRLRAAANYLERN